MRGSYSFEGRSAAGEAAATADEIAERVEASSGLRENLRAGVQVVRPPVAFEEELVRPEGTAVERDAARFLLDARQIASRDLARTRSRQLTNEHHLRTKRSHHLSPLRRVSSRHHRHEWIPPDGAHDRQARPRVPTGQLDHRLTGTQSALGLSVLDDLSCDAVLLRQPRVHVLELCEDASIEPSRQAVERDDRRVANRVDRRAADLFR